MGYENVFVMFKVTQTLYVAKRVAESAQNNLWWAKFKSLIQGHSYKNYFGYQLTHAEYY